MRGADYVIKRTLFALATVFVAVTLNFVLFRTLPGNAVSGLKCRACTVQFKQTQYGIYLKDLAHGDLGVSLVDNKPVRGELWEPLKNTIPMIALATFFSI